MLIVRHTRTPLDVMARIWLRKNFLLTVLFIQTPGSFEAGTWLTYPGSNIGRGHILPVVAQFLGQPLPDLIF